MVVVSCFEFCFATAIVFHSFVFLRFVLILFLGFGLVGPLVDGWA